MCGSESARRYSTAVRIRRGSAESDRRTIQRDGSGGYPSSSRYDCRGIRHDTPTNTADHAAPRFGLVLAMTRMRYPQSGLTALLDALERELLAAPADEVRYAWRGVGQARSIASEQVRMLLDEAIAASEDGSGAMPSLDTCAGLDRLLGISRQLRPAARCHTHASAFPVWSCRRH